MTWFKPKRYQYLTWTLAAISCILQSTAFAAVLPEDRADLLYHSYDGGGAEISGPSLLVRKKFGENVSVSANHYVDNVSSASIDVITSASPFEDKRTENDLSVDYLHEHTIMTLGYADSSESDYDAKTLSMNISQDMFGDLTTISMGFAMGDNEVRNNYEADFEEEVMTRSYNLSLSQIISKDLIVSTILNVITDEGFLNSPYRRVRYYDSGSGGYLWEDERYPNTRTSNAVALRARYYLAHRAALHFGYRFFSDTWGIEAQTYELGYTWPYQDSWVFDFSYRLYDQTRADFYSDLFPYEDSQNFLARDKELSTFNSQTIGVAASYEFGRNDSGTIKRNSVNLSIDFIDFVYDDFRDLRVNTTVGQEPNYEFDATVIRAYYSLWF